MAGAATLGPLQSEIAACTACADRFAATATGHAPLPVVWFQAGARILIAGQAPGARVHASGRPFADASGDRLRGWLEIGPEIFYDRTRIAIVPMAFCFPGYTAKGADLPPPPLCATLWRHRVLAELGRVSLTILVGGAAMNWHLGRGPRVAERVRSWRDFWPDVIPLPHPSWRNTGWLKSNPWFEAEILPALRARVQEALTQ